MKHRKRKRQTNDERPAAISRALVTGLLFFAVEVLMTSGSFSPFRLPKMTLAVAGLALLVGGWSARALWTNRLSIPTGPLAGVLVALPALQTLSAVWAQTPSVALQQALVTIVWVGAAMWLSTFTRSERRHVLMWGVWGCVISGLVLLGQLMNIDIVTVRGFDTGDRLGLTGLAGNPADLAMAGLLFVPLLLPAALAQPRRWTRWILPVFLVVTAASTQALTSLASIGLLGIGAVALLRSKRAWIVFAAAGLIGVLGISATPSLRNRIQAEWSELRQGNWYNLLSAREDGWTAATTMIGQRPIVGVGAGHYSREFFPARGIWLDNHRTLGMRGEEATHFEWAHNDPLQLVSELGLLGLVWILALIWALVRSGPLEDPVLILGILAWLPFLILHYPTHLAIGLIPALFLLAERLAGTPPVPVLRQSALARRVTAVALAGLAAFIVFEQVQSYRLDRWRGKTEQVLILAEQANTTKRRQIVRTVEHEAESWITDHERSAPWIWRTVGRARLLIAAYPEAEVSFRRAMALEPHEEAEMGLGMALAGQGRTSEAVHHLAQACKVNPALIRIIADRDLRSSVRARVRRRRLELPPDLD